MSLQTYNPHWYQSFFRGLSVEFWHRFVPPEQTQREVAWLIENLQLPSGAAVLDLPCGAARHALELAEAGYQVTGVDLSDEFLAIARKCADKRGVNITFRAGDMRSLELPPETFAGVYTLGNSFGYLDDAGTMQYLQHVAAALRPGGRFAMDTGVVAESILPTLKPAFSLAVDDLTMEIVNHYDAGHSRLQTTFTFRRGDDQEVSTSWQHVYSVAELVRRVNAAGLRVCSLQGRLGSKPYELGDGCLYLVAEKA